MRGGERCLEVLCELYPAADIYTLVYREGTVVERIAEHRIITSFVQRLPGSAARHQYYLPLFPLAIGQFDLRGYDLIVSLSHCVAKGIRVPEGIPHVSYVFTPMRYIWDQYDAYFAPGRAGWLVRTAMSALRGPLQRWDVTSNSGVSRMIAISEHVARRIKRHWGRDAQVVYPPVDWGRFAASKADDGYYLVVGALVPYKRVDLAIDAVNATKTRLVVIGTGDEEGRLRERAGPSVEFLGWQPDEVVREHYARCRALIFPGEEDFGIVPLEAMASGKPVIALAKGGALETMIPLNHDLVHASASTWEAGSPTGVYFYEATVEALAGAIHAFERHRAAFDPLAIRQHVERFDRSHFKSALHAVIDEHYQRS